MYITLFHRQNTVPLCLAPCSYSGSSCLHSPSTCTPQCNPPTSPVTPTPVQNPIAAFVLLYTAASTGVLFVLGTASAA